MYLFILLHRKISENIFHKNLGLNETINYKAHPISGT